MIIIYNTKKLSLYNQFKEVQELRIPETRQSANLILGFKPFDCFQVFFLQLVG